MNELQTKTVNYESNRTLEGFSFLVASLTNVKHEVSRKSNLQVFEKVGMLDSRKYRLFLANVADSDKILKK
jgi:hypothetical protein